MTHSTSKLIAALLLLLAMISINAMAESPGKKKAIRVLLVGGGASHDFDRWYKQEDVQTLQKEGLATVEYTSDPSAILGKLKDIDVLYLSNNQPIADKATREAIFAFVDAGKGLVLAHPALWYNWADWPEYNQKLVGGGSKGHDKYGPFEVTITGKHPVTKGVPASFKLDDELYYFKPDAAGTPIEVLATAKAETSEKVFPSIFIVKYPKGRIVGIALGHDAKSHTIEPYQTMLRNAVQWAAGK
ncbi:Type 1 glutamine amidotransferase (GATase1) [Dyadobacter soli]|uniref:Type 1 glutamine amidotransferase (GATase1) n=1 Tax=Dyadobacter soli TaxID=659014 RepID=A0A1G7RPM5_9BACT|nr:ThuA domain-containing protein [Dyadobacter soli]SDG12584.1 Type 1 glutamine amidotransferase (GATase1) [Dyadobacter soli]